MRSAHALGERNAAKGKRMSFQDARIIRHGARSRPGQVSLWALGAALVFGANPALAQIQDPQAAGVEQISPAPAEDDTDRNVVRITGSRVITNGDASPTPLTVVSADQLKSIAPANLPDALNQLPQFAGSSKPANAGPAANGNNGGNYLSMRGIGPNRTLVLLDGRRAPPTNSSASANVNLFPQALVSRVDVVTGGASAAYGSDAVAGVVNFILDTDFTGLSGEVSAGISAYDDAETFKIALAGGTELFDGRGHIVFSLDHLLSQGWPANDDAHGREWAEAGWGIISNPSGPPTNLLVRDARIVNAAPGGLIIGGALNGTQFDQDGTPIPFVFGSNRSALTAVGGDGAYLTSALPAKLRSDAAFAHFKYDVNDNTTFFLEGSVAEELTGYISVIPSQSGTAAAFTIFNDNPFIPTATRDAMAANGLASIRLGRLSADWGMPHFRQLGNNWSVMAGVEGEWGDWSYEGYAQRNVSFFKTETLENPKLQNVYNSADVVLNPTTGLPICRSTLTNPGDGCVPVNMFGYRELTGAQRDYLLGTSYSRQTLEADVYAFRVSGDLFEGWAGPIGFATGIEHRSYDAVQVVDALSDGVISGATFLGLPSNLEGQVGGYQLTNSKPSAGAYNVSEAFVEAVIPLLRDVPLAESLELNAALRYADYSTSGAVTPWKVGVSWELSDEIRARGTVSRDIRAGNFVELYSGSVQSQGFFQDPNFGNTLQFSKGLRVGNPNLDPEKSDTLTVGVVLKPNWLPEFSLSVDWYSLDIQDAISVINGQQILNACAAGVTSQCALIQRDGDGRLVAITTPYQNAAALKTSGIDIEAGYQAEIGEGTLSLRALVNHTSKLETRVGTAAPIDRAGDLRQSAGGVPEWRANLVASYAIGDFTLIAQERYLSAGKMDSTFGATGLDKNHVPARFYTDVTAKWRFEQMGADSELFLTVSNLFDQDPPPAPSQSTVTFYPTNTSLYDMIGRYYMGGLRFRF